ncbi:hypothetical protein EZJ49_09320 [Bdellovibrio bacteriovorus]|uniref:hypothetical protein n=1 Tax=Bdellovibrio bacteriovorus TaxID=959 RepID=UPI0021D25E2E|nr:hypothetical protein [Bdellovibrio bacteriovorus]UXR63276.1 hypothetical protein EZJ49_09320 [Bdellovibrio bacteriovorus]
MFLAKTLLAAIISLIPLTVVAYPSIGDKVSWTGEINRNGETLGVKITKEILSHDKENHLWKIRIDASIGDENNSHIVETPDMYTPEKFKSIIADCVRKGGKLEKLKAPAGTYNTCKMSTTLTDGTLIERWWGDIPFGVVSKSTRDSGKIPVAKPDLDSIIAGL